MKRTFLDIPTARYVAYIIAVIGVTVLVNLVLKETALTIANIILPATLTIITGVLSNFMPRHKGYESLLWLAAKLKFVTGKWIKPKLDDDFNAYVHKQLSLGETEALKVLIYLIEHTIHINKTFFPNAAGMCDAFLRSLISEYKIGFRKKLRTALSQKGFSDSIYKKYDREVIYSDLQREAGSDKRLIKELKTLINHETISLRFADFFHSNAFEKSTPYLIVGKYANTQPNGLAVLTQWALKHPSIANPHPYYVSMPPALSGGSFVQYLFLPEPEYHSSAHHVFEAIRQEYQAKGLDIEKVFLSISAVFHESNYVHIGKRIENLQAFARGLRQFLFFKTSNTALTTSFDLGQTILNNCDQTTMRQIIEKLPLTFYLKGIAVSPSERRYLEKKSADFYARFGNMKSFMVPSEGERQVHFAEICDGKDLRYASADFRAIRAQKRSYDKDSGAFKRKRLNLICSGISDNFARYEKLTA